MVQAYELTQTYTPTHRHTQRNKEIYVDSDHTFRVKQVLKLKKDRHAQTHINTYTNAGKYTCSKQHTERHT